MIFLFHIGFYSNKYIRDIKLVKGRDGWQPYTLCIYIQFHKFQTIIEEVCNKLHELLRSSVTVITDQVIQINWSLLPSFVRFLQDSGLYPIAASLNLRATKLSSFLICFIIFQIFAFLDTEIFIALLVPSLELVVKSCLTRIAECLFHIVNGNFGALLTPVRELTAPIHVFSKYSRKLLMSSSVTFGHSPTKYKY